MNFETVELQTVDCGQTNFDFNDTEELLFKGVPALKCVKWADKGKLEIGGAYSSDLFKTINIKVVPCRNSTTY